MRLCVVVNAKVHEAKEGTPVIVFELLDDDYWGCLPDELVHCAGLGDLPAKKIRKGMRVWLDIPILVSDGTFVANIN